MNRSASELFVPRFIFNGLLSIAALYLTYFVFSVFLQWLKSKSRHARTSTPTIPFWFESSKIIKSYLTKQSRVYTRHYTNQSNFFYCENRKTVIWKLRKIVENLLRTKRMESLIISNETCGIQIPMENFRCGKRAGEFEVLYPPAPGTPSYFTYEVFGDEVFLATYYHEEDNEYLAGVTVFVFCPYRYGFQYQEKFLLHLARMPSDFPKRREETVDVKWIARPNQLELVPVVSTSSNVGRTELHELNEDTNQFQNVACPYFSRIVEPVEFTRSIMRNLHVKFCLATNEPVIIGFIQLTAVHVHWDGEARVFKHEYCAFCADSTPPDYGSLDIKTKSLETEGYIGG